MMPYFQHVASDLLPALEQSFFPAGRQIPGEQKAVAFISGADHRRGFIAGSTGRGLRRLLNFKVHSVNGKLFPGISRGKRRCRFQRKIQFGSPRIFLPAFPPDQHVSYRYMAQNTCRAPGMILVGVCQ